MLSKQEMLLLALFTAALNPLTLIPAAGGLLFLWLLQRPVSPLCDELGAKPWVKRLVGFFYMQLQRNVDRPAAAARDTGAGSAAEEAEGDADGLLWHLAFGSNMNPEVLGGRRNVKPKRSEPCCVKGYTLAFSHRGMPYWEPSFATIVPYEEAEADPAHSSLPAELHSEHRPLQNGTAGAATQAGAADDADDAEDDAVSASSEREGAMQQAWRAVSRPFVGGAPTPAVPRPFSTAGGEPALHGVVHQISVEDMREIQRTEGGGGNKDMGYQLAQVACTLYDGTEVQACAFITHPNDMHSKSLVYAHPSERYLKIVRGGAAHSKLDLDFQRHLCSLQAYRVRTVGQAMAAYAVLFFMLALGILLLGLLLGHRLLLRRKADGKYMHRFIGRSVRVLWWAHNNVFGWLFGRGC